MSSDISHRIPLTGEGRSLAGKISGEGVVFWTTSAIKDEKSAAKFHYVKTQRQSYSAINCLSSGINILAIYWQGIAPFP